MFPLLTEPPLHQMSPFKTFHKLFWCQVKHNSHRAESSHYQPPTPQNQSSHLDVDKMSSTHINVSQLKNYLQFYPDQNIAAELIHGFSQGFYISYDGQRRVTDCRNIQ